MDPNVAHILGKEKEEKQLRKDLWKLRKTKTKNKRKNPKWDPLVTVLFQFPTG